MNTNPRAAYMDAAVATASPARLLVMLYDRLVLDVRRALDALERDDRPESHNQLVHAQAIVMELRASLDPTGFRGGEQLASLYDHLHSQLIKANVAKDAELTAHCLDVITQLAEVWREAALQSLRSAS
jgi:flagellar protein FliS